MEEATLARAGASPAAIDAPTVCAAFQLAAAEHADRVALRTKGDDVTITWAQYAERVRALAAGLAGLGVKRGETVAIQLTNRPEFHLLDMAAVHLGAAPFSVYNTSTSEQVRERLENAESRIVITEQAFLPVVREAAEAYGRIEHLIVVDGSADGALGLAEVEAEADRDFDFEAAWRAVQPGDVLTLIYTSGTTGPPKGAQLSHGGVLGVLRSLDQIIPLPRESQVSWMPMAHVGERMMTQYMPLAYGATSTSCPNPREIAAALPDARPDALFSPPRLWEKLRSGIQAQIEGLEDEEKKTALKGAIEVGLRRVRAEQAGEEVPEDLAEQQERAKEGLRSTLLSRLGLDRLEIAFIGGAPSPPEVVEFFQAIGVPLLEAYGLTEASAFGAIYPRADDFRIGTAGRPVPGVEFKLAEDGEILLRSEMNMVGYRKEPEKTAEALDPDGWLHTGDIGEVDEDGYVSIVDRKKELIINATGKNMSPANIEAEIKKQSPLIGQAVAIGDGRPYNVALITLDPEGAAVFANQHAIEDPSIEALSRERAVIDEVSAAVERANERLSRVEQIKRFELLPVEWQPDSEELTPTMKLKRKPISAKYEQEIEGLYTEAVPRATNGSSTEQRQASELVIRCPANGRVAGRVPIQGPEEVAELARELREEQAAWEAIGPEGRARWLGLWRDWIFDNSDRLLSLVQEESGKSWGDATIEIQACAEVMNHYANNAAAFLEERRPRPHNLVAHIKRLRVVFRPYPLVGVISPWNYPLAMPMLDIPAPLMAGCAVLSKPSEVAPLAWTEAVRGWNEEIGAPRVLAVANGGGETGAAVIDQVDMVQFTGSVATGRRVAARAGERLIPCSLELGGNDAMIVLSDANLERAVNGAVWGGMFNAGQSCVAVERIYVEAPVYDEFVGRLTEKVRGLRQGMDQPRRYETDLGATATEQQLEIVERQVNDAVAKGATTLTGGKRRGGGLFFEPTVLVNVDNSMQCMREETFGPLLPVARVADAEEAIRLANDSTYGLSATVWSRDEARAQSVAQRLEVGGVNINDVMMNVFQFSVPHGGWRDSGVGSRYGGPDGIRKYCRAQAIVSGRVAAAPKSEVHWYPHSRMSGRVQTTLARVLGAGGWRRRLGLGQRRAR